MLDDLTRFMWVDKNGNVAGPLHETIKSAVNYRVNWKQAQGKLHTKKYGEGLTPTILKKVIISHNLLEDQETKTLSAILNSDEEEENA